MKKVIIMQGIPGSGKSSAAEMRAHKYYEEMTGCTIISNDDYFIDEDGNYNFDYRRMNSAVARTIREFVYEITDEIEVIIVDNTNTTPLECAVFVDLARAFDYEIEFVRTVCDPAIAFKRNKHGVPEGTIRKMANRLDQFTFSKHWKYTLTVLNTNGTEI
jgi:tRNA uridine 5-carbamoylmethylation protein Kti12